MLGDAVDLVELFGEVFPPPGAELMLHGELLVPLPILNVLFISLKRDRFI